MKVGYHSGSWLLEIAGPMPSSTCLPPFKTSTQVVYLVPNFIALKRGGKVGHGCHCD